MIISFVGHSFIGSSDKVKEIVKDKIKNNIVDVKKVECYLGGYGDFDEICLRACRELKKENPNIEVIYITPYISLSWRSKIEKNIGLYDFSIYPPIENVPPKYAILKRNEWMMINADLIIAYVNCGYGGAYRSLQVAKREKKKIINIADLL